ncbi:MAG: ferritin family protein [Deltaproteobacteria bacterium]|nr:ferritin family protein [Deltaproteobacteria bacterium]
MDEKERLNALEVALNNEFKEREFYLKNAERTRNSLGEAMFKQIADEELEHYERLKELHARWSKTEKWPDTVPLKVKDTLVKDVLKDVIKQVERTSEKDEDDLDAIRVAIEFESKGVIYYQNLRDEVSDPQEKAFFDLLSKIEREHYLSLKEAEEFLVDPESWYTRVEHPSLDGA